MTETDVVSGMIEGFALTEGDAFFVFGHPHDSFVLGRFQIVEGVQQPELTRSSKTAANPSCSDPQPLKCSTKASATACA